MPTSSTPRRPRRPDRARPGPAQRDAAPALAVRRPAAIERLARQHAERVEAGLARTLRTVERVDGTRLWLDGRALIHFASNDYLGLSQHAAVREALFDGARRWGVGAGAAHLLGGHRAPHAALEAALARWLGRERALLFSTGYMANLGIAQALLADGDLLVEDKLNHASLIDAARIAGADLRRYVHGDLDGARRQLEGDAVALLATDGVFSMDGDIAPLAGLAALARERGATLVVDDAHGLGVLGRDGAGCVADAALSSADVPVLMGTLGKALGVAGAFVAGDAALIDGLVQFARTFVYTTALPPGLAAATLAAIEVARHEDWRRAQLRRLIAHFRAGAQERGLTLLDSRTPIQPLVVGASDTAAAASAALADAGFYVPAIRPPTVPQGKARLRVTLCALHAEQDVDALLAAVAAIPGLRAA